MRDQEFNLDPVVALGAGIHLSELRFRPEHVQRAVQQVLSDAAYREGAERQQAIVNRFDGPRAGAQAIDKFLGRRSGNETGAVGDTGVVNG